MSDAVTKTIVGTCQEIEQKPGSEWVKFKIDVGTQYPVALSTKKPEVIAKAREAGSLRAAWRYLESEGNENPNKPGTHFMNRWIQDVITDGEAVDLAEGELQQRATAVNTGSTPAPQRAVQGSYDMISQGDKDRAISRMSCLSSAAALLQGVQFQNEAQRVAAWVSAAAAAERHVYRNIEEDDSLDGDDVPF